mgnify:CR=1 FL=1
MKFLFKIVNTINCFSKIIGRIAKYIIFIIIGIMLVEIFSRYFLNHPTEWSVELSTYLFGSYFFLSGGYVFLREKHVRMDILYIKWSRRRKKIADIATFPLMVVYLGLFIYGGIKNIQYSLKFNEHSNSLWGPPLAPIKIVIVIGALLLLIQGVSNLISDILILFNKEFPNIREYNRENK